MGSNYTGGIGYADDLTLLKPKISGLKVLIKMCEQYADDHCVKFNSATCMYFAFIGRSCKVCRIIEQLFLMAPIYRVFRMPCMWATKYPLLIKIA